MWLLSENFLTFRYELNGVKAASSAYKVTLNTTVDTRVLA